MRKINLYSCLKYIGIFIASITISSCSSQSVLPKSQGELHSAYSYIPLDPLPVSISPAKGCSIDKLESYLKSLPDQAVRIAIGQVDTSGSLSFGPVQLGSEGHSYQVILDYISVDAAHIPVRVSRVPREPGASPYQLSVFDNYPKGETNYTVYSDPDNDILKNDATQANNKNEYLYNLEKVTIPVYVGVGLRLTASLTVIKGKANLSSLAAIAAAAEAGKITGTLTVQTLGITGKTISTTLPLPSEINQTTIQNSILSLGAIKAVLYDGETTITPRVVGIYNPIGGGQQVANGIVSVLAKNPIKWERPCSEIKQTNNLSSSKALDK